MNFNVLMGLPNSLSGLLTIMKCPVVASGVANCALIGGLGAQLPNSNEGIYLYASKGEIEQPSLPLTRGVVRWTRLQIGNKRSERYSALVR